MDKPKLLALLDQMREAILADDTPAVPGPIDPPAKPITRVVIENTGGDQTGVPVTFGHIFAPGHLPAGMGLQGAQLDVKAKHPDGSVRHALVSMVLPALAEGEKQEFALVPVALGDAKAGKPARPVDFSVDVRLPDGEYRVSPSTFAAFDRAVPLTEWLRGGTVSEAVFSAPLRRADGTAHPHLSARFALRQYHDTGRTRLDVTIENTWAYEPNPQNFTYDVEIVVGGKVSFQQKGLTHYHHARWRHVAWLGDEPHVHVRHDTAYLIASRAVPNYDQSVVVPEKTLVDMDARWSKLTTQPMGTGFADAYMPRTGGRADIGILPQWAAAYVLSMDERAARITIGTSELAGSWSTHYRDKNTGRPVSIEDYPYMTILGRAGDTLNPATKKREAFPGEGGPAKSPYSPDTSHQPSLSYLPYLLTGDYYHLEELQFWAMWNVISPNPAYREYSKGIVQHNQVRGQAWSLRTLGHAAYITPDSHPLKDVFNRIVQNNIDWYTANLVENSKANKLGFIETYGPIYGAKDSVGPWQDDFVTSAFGVLMDLGFTEAEKITQWKSRFPVLRMVGEGVCWLAASKYSYRVRASETSPFFDTIGDAYRASVGPEVAALPCGDAVAAALGNKPGDMGGYSKEPTGYPSNMQPALAYAADYGGEEGKRAWAVFMARSIKPDYGPAPQFAIVPRSVVS